MADGRNTISVERVIKPPPDKIFALLADAGKHASFDGSESVNHASQKSVPLSMGAKFGMAARALLLFASLMAGSLALLRGEDLPIS